MRKKLFAAMLTVISAIACAVGITSCSVRSEDNKPCEHSYVYTKLDAENHSGECSKCHDTVTEKHEFSGDKCAKCGYDRTTESFTVTFDANGGTLSGNSTQTVKYNGTVTEPAEPNRGGYKFVGWTSGSGSTLWDFATGKVTSDITLKASWLQIFDVTFDANGGKFADDNATLSVKATDGDKLEVPAEPARAGAVFVGWFGDDKLTLKWNFDTDTVVSDKTLYAGWKITERDVTFVLNFEGAENVTETTQDGLVTYVPTRTGYVFNGWWLSEGQISDGSYILTQKWDKNEVVLSDGLVLYAEWVEESTVATQLPAPSIVIDGNVLTWDEVDSAKGYRIQVRKYGASEDIFDGSVTDTRWTFPANYEAGYYNISVRSNGDGINAVNSAYVTKSFAHKILAMPADIECDITTSVLTWSSVKYATSYSLYLNGELVEKTERTTYDMSAFDAGRYSVKIVAEKSDYISSSATKEIEKFRLRTPQVLMRVDRELKAYYLCWESVYGADSYIIKLNDKEITVNETSYTLGSDSELWGDAVSGVICVNAYDSNADYIVSVNAEQFNVAKLYVVTVGSDIDGAGDLTVSGDLYRLPEYTVSFNLNGAYGTAPETQHVTSTKGLKYPDVPTRDGYVFGGWCFDKDGKNKFDFANEITSDMTLYAGWHEIATTGKRNVVVDIAKTANTSNISDYHEFLGSASYAEPDYLYFTAHRTGNYTLEGVVVSNSSSMSTGYFYVYNVTQGKTLADLSRPTSSWFNTVAEFEANAGDVIYVRFYPGGSGSNVWAYVYVTGGSYPADAVCNGNYYMPAESSDKGEALLGNGATVTVTAEPASENYTFLGWYDGETLLTEGLTYTFDMPAKDVNYTAKWLKAKLSTAVNDAEAGTVTEITEESVISGKEITVVATTNDGYTFLGWYDGDTELTKELSYTFTMPATDIVYTAKWCRVTVETSDGNAGTVTELNGKYKYGEQVTVTATTNDGYTFLGWFNGDTELTKELSYTFTMPAENTIYTAKWTYYTLRLSSQQSIDGDVTNYTLSFDMNGATCDAPVSQTVNGGNCTEYPEIPTWDGHVFAGWYENAECTGNPFVFGASITDNITLYAKWVEYSGNGVLPYNGSKKLAVSGRTESTDYYAFVPLASGPITVYSGSGIGDTYGYLYDADKKELKSDDDSGDGRNFSITYNMTAGTLYYVRPCAYSGSGETTVYITGPEQQVISDRGVGITVNDTVYNGAQKITAGEQVTVTADLRTDCVWIGWYDGDTRLTGDFSYTFTMPAANVEYAAKWCTVSFESNDDGAGTVTASNVGNKYGDETTVTAETNSGYTFIGWYNGNTELTKELVYTFEMPDKTTLYTAKWCKVSTEKSDEKAGTVTELNDKYKSGEEITVTATTNDGYTFVGWYQGDTELTKELSYTFEMPAENTVYTAKWTANVYTITLDVQGGNALDETTLEIDMGTKITFAVPEKENYVFGGWYTDGGDKIADGSGEMSEDWSIASDTALVAKWLRTITFDVDGGEVVQAIYVEAGTVANLPAAKKTGYTFAGWQLDGTTYSETFNMPDENVAFTAKWTANTYYISYNGTSMAVKYGEHYSIPTPTRSGYTFRYFRYSGSSFSQSGAYHYPHNVSLDCVWLADLSRTVSGATTVSAQAQYLQDYMTFTITYNGSMMKNFNIVTNCPVNINFNPGWSYSNVTDKGINVNNGTTSMTITITIIKAPTVGSFTCKFTCGKNIVSGPGY